MMSVYICLINVYLAFNFNSLSFSPHISLEHVSMNVGIVGCGVHDGVRIKGEGGIRQIALIVTRDPTPPRPAKLLEAADNVNPTALELTSCSPSNTHPIFSRLSVYNLANS